MQRSERRKRYAVSLDATFESSATLTPSQRVGVEMIRQMMPNIETVVVGMSTIQEKLGLSGKHIVDNDGKRPRISQFCSETTTFFEYMGDWLESVGFEATEEEIAHATDFLDIIEADIYGDEDVDDDESE